VAEDDYGATQRKKKLLLPTFIVVSSLMGDSGRERPR
jgi:hypothetical protein